MATHAKRSKRIITKKEFETKISEENLRILERYKRHQSQKGLSEKSIYNYERDILHFLSWLTENNFGINLIDVEEEDVEDFIWFCKEQGNNEARIRRRMSSISTLFIFMRIKKMIKENPIEFIPRPKKGDDIIEHVFLTIEQVYELKRLLTEKDDIQLMTYFMISMDSMGRVGALSVLTWESMDRENRMFRNTREKGGKIKNQPFSQETLGWIDKLIEYRKENNIDDKGYVFITTHGNPPSSSTCNSWSKTIGNLIGEPNLHPHSFRKSGSQIRKLAGMSPTDLQQLLGHASVDTTIRFYTKEDEKETMKKFDEFQIF